MLAQLSISAADVMENESSIEFTIRLDRPASEPIDAEFSTIDGTARAGHDYVGIDDRPIRFAPGETEHSVRVSITDNLLRDGDRYFSGRVRTSGSESSVDSIIRLTRHEHLVFQKLTPDGETVIYGDSDGFIYSIPIDGSATARQLSTSASFKYQSTPDSRHLVFVTKSDQDVEHVYSVPIDGSSAPVRISGSLGDDSVDPVTDVFITPDSQSVVFVYRQSAGDDYEAYLTPIDGASPATPVGTGPIGRTIGLSDDGRHFVYHATNLADVFSVPLDASHDPTELTAGIPAPRFFEWFDVLGDNVYVAANYPQNIYTLYRMPVDGMSPATAIASHRASRLRLTEDGRHLLYYVDRGIFQPKELYSVPIDGSSEPTPLVPGLGGEDDVWEFDLSESGDVVVYTAQQSSEFAEVYRVPADGSELPMQLSNGDLIGSATWIRITPDGDRALFMAYKTEGGNSTTKLYSVTTDGLESPIDLSPQIGGGLSAYGFPEPMMSADGRTISYLVKRENGDLVGLYSVPVDGSEPPRLLHPPVPDEGTINKSNSAFRIGPRGTVVMVHDDDPLSSPPQVVQLYASISSTAASRDKALVMILDDDLLVADFGDAPTSDQTGFAHSYPVSLEQNGARHTVGSLFLGGGVDVEVDGVYDSSTNPPATGDDIDEGATDSGITARSTIVTSEHETVTSFEVVVSGPGKIDAWIDFNRDGDWDDPGEQIFAAQSIQSGRNLLSAEIPAGAGDGPTAARFRLSTNGGLGPTGAASDGEVEDYWLTLTGAHSTPVSAELLLPPGESRIQLETNSVSLFASTTKQFESPLASLAELSLRGTTEANTIHLDHAVASQISVAIDGIGLGNRLILTADTSEDAPSVFDFTAGGTIDATAIEEVILDTSGSVHAILDAQAIASLSDTDPVLIVGGQDDRLIIADAANWRMGQPEIVDESFLRRLIHVTSGETLHTDFPHAWNNLVDRNDVNNDGAVTPLDALQIINRLARREASGQPNQLGDPAAQSHWEGVYVDTNGDDMISPRDALQVINVLAFQLNNVQTEGLLDFYPKEDQKTSPVRWDAALGGLF